MDDDSHTQKILLAIVIVVAIIGLFNATVLNQNFTFSNTGEAVYTNEDKSSINQETESIKELIRVDSIIPEEPCEEDEYLYTSDYLFVDDDLDSYGTTQKASICQKIGGEFEIPEGSRYNTDCDDTDPSIYPNSREIESDSKDNDCDGTIDEIEPKTEICPSTHQLVILSGAKDYVIKSGCSGAFDVQINSNDLTLDCQGEKITPNVWGPISINNQERITIKNCVIGSSTSSRITKAINIRRSKDIHLEDITILGLTATGSKGISISESRGQTSISNSGIEGFEYGLYLEDAKDVFVINSELTANNHGIYETTTDPTLQNNLHLYSVMSCANIHKDLTCSSRNVMVSGSVNQLDKLTCTQWTTASTDSSSC
ncbi:hypothetical protein HOC01_06350 [archaeon]|jgi:hypothetical protein|nr:hypothetical protein [archaeon]MBT6697538.1 hypothetical protein [archaeon]